MKVRMCSSLIILLLLTSSFLGVAQEKPDQTLQREIPTVTYCELLSSPDTYDRKVVRIKALYVFGFEASALEDPQCHSEKSTWVEFDETFRRSSKKDVLRKFDEIFYPPRKKTKGVIERPGPYRAELVVLGQFNGPKPGIPIGPERKRVLRGYGHLGGYDYQFTITCIEQVKPAPWQRDGTHQPILK